MFFYHLRLLLRKSFLYAWRRRICRCCPKVIFEIIFPLLCLALLALLRWIHTSSKSSGHYRSGDYSRTSPFSLRYPPIFAETPSTQIFNHEISSKCPAAPISIEFRNSTIRNLLKSRCPSLKIEPERVSLYTKQLILEQSKNGLTMVYVCQYYEKDNCQIEKESANFGRITIQNPSEILCSGRQTDEFQSMLQTAMTVQSILYPPKQKKVLSIYTWPCSSYASDSMFRIAPHFVLIFILIFIDGSILFGFNLLIHEIIKEKRQGITEQLRLISVQPILNSLAWFIRVLIVQLVSGFFLCLILKISFEGGIYLPNVSWFWIIPSILLWIFQTLSRAVVLGHFFKSDLKASLWSWLTYVGSFWLAVTTMFRLPFVFHLMASVWFPFYSIKRLMVFFIRINTDLNHYTKNHTEIIFLWISMIFGTILMWLLAYYLEQVRPGKYGIARPWLWPLESLRQLKRRRSVDMNLVETETEFNTTVRVNNLSKSYGSTRSEKQLAVSNISFKLEKSKIHGLIGHNGAGKTTTIEMICGLLPWDSGTIEIHDKDLEENLEELRHHVGYCPQQDMLFSFLTVEEQLEFYARVRSEGKEFDRAQIDQLLTMMDIGQYKNRLCKDLSGGMQRKLSILCAFAGKCDVILLDEPSSSLDPVARRVLWSWLRANKMERTLLISSHLLDEVEELCDSIIILDSGIVRAQGTVLELKTKFGPQGDRIHVDRIPNYLPANWIVDQKNLMIQVPDRKKFIDLLERLESDQIKYSLNNVTLDDVFVRLTSGADVSIEEDSKVSSRIGELFRVKTSTDLKEIYLKQILAVFIRRGQLLARRARLLPIILLVYLIYALSPLYAPSLSFGATAEQGEYIISARSSALLKLLPTNQMKFEEAPWFDSSEEFQNFLSKVPLWQSDYLPRRSFIGLRLVSNGSLECFVPQKFLLNTIKWCWPIFSSFSNTTQIPLQLVPPNSTFDVEMSSIGSAIANHKLFYCFHTIPPALYFPKLLIFMILVVCAALAIQDNASGIHSYALIHGLRPFIHWSVTFICDFILCLVWWTILITVARFIDPLTFDGQFFGLTILLYVVCLPFTYILAKFLGQPVLGAFIILFIFNFAEMLSNLRILFVLLGSREKYAIYLDLFRWLFIIIFPNINVFTLIVSVLRPDDCIQAEQLSESFNTSTNEIYPYKKQIHSIIFIGQFVIYFIILHLIDTVQFPVLFSKNQEDVNREEDNDVLAERERIETMTDEEKQNEALVADNLSKRYFGTKSVAVNRLTFAVPHRQCFGLLGFNGSGKTTTFRMLVGDLQRTGGRIHRNENEYLGYCPQDDINFSALTVLQSINYICRLHGIKPSKLNLQLIKQFQFEKYKNHLISHLSGGTRRRLHLALCLIGSPNLLVLDEPTAKVDPLLRSHIRLILEHRPIETSIIFASHSMLECEQLCDRLTILVRGSARCLGTIRHLKEKFGTDYRIRLTKLDPSFKPTELKQVDESDEYTYPKLSLFKLFQTLQGYVEQNQIASNYTVQLTSLEHIFLSFQQVETPNA